MTKYTPNTWNAGDTITKTKLDRLEAGVAVVLPERDMRRQPVPLAIKAHGPADSANNKSSSSLLGGTAKFNHLMVRTAWGIRLVYVNWVSGTSNTEMDGWNDILVGGAIEYNNSIIPVTFNGAKRVTITPGGIAISDPIGIDVAKGATISSRTYVEVTSGQFFPLSGIPQQSSGEGNNYASPAGADLTLAGSASLTGVATGGPYAYGPAAILGLTVDPDKPVIAIAGDSIAQGTGETSAAAGGFFQRALGGNYSFQKIAFPGEALGSGFVTANGVNRRRRITLLAMCGVTHAVTDYTVNSLSTTTVQQDAVTAWVVLSRVAFMGVWASTLTPQTTSTNAWATTTNQTVADATKESRRIAFNNWLRDGAPINASLVPQAVGASGAGIVRAGAAGHPLKGYFEVADLAETARNSGIWKAGYTGDGTHPNATGHTALAAAIDPTLFGAPSE